MIIIEANRLISLYRRNWEGEMEELLSPSDVPSVEELKRQKRFMRVLNISDIRRSMRFNPIQLKYLPTLQDTTAFAEKLLNVTGITGETFYMKAAANFLAACLWFFMNYRKKPFDADRNMLYPEYREDPETYHQILTGRVFLTEEFRDMAEKDSIKKRVNSVGLTEPAFWLGKYSDMPHVLSFLNHDYNDMFEVLKTDPEIYSLINPFITAYNRKAWEQLVEMIDTLRIMISRLVSKELFWILHRDGDDFDLSDRFCHDYLMIVGSPTHQLLLKPFSQLVTGLVPSGEPHKYNISEGYKWGSYDLISEAVSSVNPYSFDSREAQERVLYANFYGVQKDIDEMVTEIMHEYAFRKD